MRRIAVVGVAVIFGVTGCGADGGSAHATSVVEVVTVFERHGVTLEAERLQPREQRTACPDDRGFEAGVVCGTGSVSAGAGKKPQLPTDSQATS